MTRYTIQKALGAGWWLLRWELLPSGAWGHCTIIRRRYRHRSAAALALTDLAAKKEA